MSFSHASSSATTSSSTGRRHPYSIFTHSLGSHGAGHTLPHKLRAAAEAGYDAIELFQDDLDAFASSAEFASIYAAQTPPDSPRHTTERQLVYTEGDEQPVEVDATEPERLTAFNAHGPCTPTVFNREIAAACHIAGLCRTLGLEIVTLQPFRDFEGWTSATDQKNAMERAKSRFPVMRALGTDLLLICSNNAPAPRTVGNTERIAQDLAAVADAAAAYDAATMGAGPDSRVSKPLRIGYEGLSWGAHVSTWYDAWTAVRMADRSNLGLILDSFNALAREWADPCSPTGIKQPSESEPSIDAQLRTSLSRLGSPTSIERVPGHKIFLLQIGDARKLAVPLPPSPNATELRPALMIWSRSNRVMPCEKELGAFMPVPEFMRAAVRGTGYEGPWSIEIFNDSLNEKGENVPEAHAKRGIVGLDRIVEQVYA